jgi:iron complex outermembrane recepter protein
VLKGSQMAAMPNRELYASLQWSENGYAVRSKNMPQGLSANLDWIARSHMWADDANTAYVAGYGVFNAQVRETFKYKEIDWQAFAIVNNIGNRNYVGSVIVNQTAGQFYEPGLPRNWVTGLQGQMRF